MSGLNICRLTLAIGALIMVSNTPLEAKPSAQNLLTEYLENPLGIDVSEPRFSWLFDQEGRQTRQRAYRIHVSADPEFKNLCWDSGKVLSNQTTNVPLKNQTLESAARYFWRAKVWDAKNVESDWSSTAWFEMGLLKQDEWEGDWITGAPGGNGYHSDLSADPNAVKWVQIDLGQNRNIARIVLHPARPFNWQEDAPGFGFPVRYKIEGSGNPDFDKPVLLADRTGEDQPNPGTEPITMKFDPVRTRYVRLTATKMYRRMDGQQCLALADMQIINTSGHNVGVNRPVTALDSIEDHGWSKSLLTDGLLHSMPPSQVAPMFRWEFEVKKQVERARAYVAGLGYCELHLNGDKIGDRVLDPAYTSFSKRVIYAAYDVTDHLKKGRNAVGAVLGKGWFKEPPRMILQLNIEFTDGSKTSVFTNSDWKRSGSPIREDSLYHGETYDARLEQPGWDKPGFDDSDWQVVNAAPSPTSLLSGHVIQPITVTETIKPETVSSPKEGVWVYDFGQNFSGWCRLKVSGSAGTEVRLRHAELLYPDGTINSENLRSARATDRYILKGEGTEVWEPRFTYHGFRYVQVEGFPGEPNLEALEGRVVHTCFEPDGSFECSDALINRIHRNSCWGFRTNFHSVPTDCPQRDERQGWMGDAHMTADMGFYNFDVAAAYTKFLQDIQDAQGEDGRIPDTVPHVWGSNPGDPMWAAAYHFIAWDMYRHTGDKALLARHYDGMKSYVDMLAREADNYIITRNNYGDWVGVVETPKDLISTGSFYRVSQLVSRMASVLGKKADTRKYEDLCGKIAEAFNSRFFREATNEYGNGSQYSNSWPLYLGIVPENKRQAVVNNLIHDITVNHKGHLSTGFLGARYLLEVLCNEGHPEVAYNIVTKEDYPGWGYMIANGATTIWELWKLETGPGMNSHNHPAFGFVSGWFYQALAGITPGAEKAGFEHFDIKPYVLGDLKQAKASVNTVQGLVKSEWVRTAGGLRLKAVIPANLGASVWVPKLRLADVEVKEGGKSVWKGGKYAAGVEGITGASDEGDWIRFEVGSGEYAFEITGTGQKSASALRVGAGSQIVSPPVGTSLAGYFHDRPSTAVHDDLLAKAVVLDDGETQAAVVVCDILRVPADIVSEVRRIVSEATGIPAGNILVSATHTHTGPETRTLRVSPVNEEYLAQLPRLIADAVISAHKNLRPAILKSGEDYEDRVAFNRRFRMKDGSVRFNPGKLNPDIIAPDGPIDPQINVIRADGEDGKPIAILVNYSLHPDVMGGTEISADWPGELCRLLSGMFNNNPLVVYAQGTSGNINHVDVSTSRPQKGWAEVSRIARVLAGKALAAAELAEPMEDTSLGVASTVLGIKYHPLTDGLRKKSEDTLNDPNAKEFELAQARRIRDYKLDGQTADVEVQAIRIGESAIVGVPGEYFVEYGLDIKEWSPFDQTIIVQLANGSFGYIPTLEAFYPGTYETMPILSAVLEPSAGTKIANAAAILLRKLAEDGMKS